MTLAVAVLAVACGGGGGSGGGGSGGGGRSQSTTLTIGEKFERAGDSVQVFSYTPNVPRKHPGFGDTRQLGAIDVELCAGNKGFLFDQTFFKLSMADNTEAERALGEEKDPALNSSAPVAAGTCSRGFLTYEVPAGVKPAAVIYGFLGPSIRWTIP